MKIHSADFAKQCSWLVSACQWATKRCFSTDLHLFGSDGVSAHGIKRPDDMPPSKCLRLLQIDGNTVTAVNAEPDERELAGIQYLEACENTEFAGILVNADRLQTILDGMGEGECSMVYVDILKSANVPALRLTDRNGNFALLAGINRKEYE